MTELRSSFTLPAAPALPLRPARWLAPAWTTLPLTAQRCRVRNPINGVVAFLDANRHAVLVACEGCRTLDEHFALVQARLNVRHEDARGIQAWLREFAAQGLLVAEADLVGRLGNASSEAVAPFAGIVLRTCDRPALLARALDSAAALAARHGRRDRLIVLDDSRDAAHRTANRATVAGHKGLDATHVDLSASTPLVTEVARCVPEAADALEWLLGKPTRDEATYGRPINYALLMSAGRRLLLQDDDALLEPRQPPLALGGWTVSSARDELYCYAGQDALEAACPPLTLDPIAAHLDCLGAPVASLWARYAAENGAPETLDVASEDHPRFASDARVLFTQNHALGDPGSSLFPYHLLSLPHASRMRLMHDEATVHQAFTARNNWRGQPRPRLALRRALTFTTLAGLDNSVMLPPTVRAYRNEDLLLGEVAQHVHRSAWFVDLPWALPHWRDAPKTWLDATATFNQEPAHFLMDYLASRATNIASDDPAARMRGVGALLQDLASASDRHLAAALEEQAADTATRALFSVAEQLDDATLPVAWKHVLRPWLDSAALSLDAARLRERIAPVPQVRALAAAYGNALAVWPALWTAARELTV